MIYLFTGNSDYLIKEEVKGWKNHFISKYGDFNLIHIKNINDIDNNFLAENITATSFLSDKKLVIIDIEKEINKEKENILTQLITKIPENNIILFSYINPDKRSKFYKNLKKTAKVKELNIKDTFDIQGIISKKYGNKISNQAINTIIKYKSGNLIKIFSEIEKLLIIFDYINNEEIIKNIAPELEESIFQVIDNILNGEIIKAIEKIDIILSDTNIYAFYNNLIANLRTSIYILKMKADKNNITTITSRLNLGNRAFLVNKKYKISDIKAISLYINLINIDKRMKTGKLLGSKDGDFKYEIEKVLLKN